MLRKTAIMALFLAVAAVPLSAAPDLSKYVAPAIALKGLPYELSLRAPRWTITTLDGSAATARFEVLSGKTSSVMMRPDLGWIQIVNRAPAENSVWEAFGNDGYVDLVVAPLTNLKGKKHRLTCTITDAKQPIAFAVSGRPDTVRKLKPEDNGFYFYDFETQSGATSVFIKPVGNPSVFFYGCKVSMAK